MFESINEPHIINIERKNTNSSHTNDFAVWFPVNPIVPPSFMARVRNINFSPVMCCEQPLSMYHDLCFSFLLKHIFNINNYRLRYPYLYKSFRLSSERFILLLCLVLEVKWLMFIQDFRAPFGLDSHEATIVFLI